MMISSEKNSDGPTSIGGLDQHLQPGRLRGRALQVLVRVLDHHDRRIHHRPDGDGDTAQAHDVGADAERLHRDERHQNADRQHDDRHQRRADVQQEGDAHQGDDDALLDQRCAAWRWRA